MQDFWFYILLGFDHVMDASAYDHVLFLSALALPFSFKSWKKVVLLATVFTIAHCLSLTFSAYGIIRVAVGWIEFLIPVTILMTAIFDLVYSKMPAKEMGMYVHLPATAFFGLIHGFGFSNYFNMMMSGVDEKLLPLLGFAFGIEFSQCVVILIILCLAYLTQVVFQLNRRYFIVIGATIVALTTIPMLIATFPS